MSTQNISIPPHVQGGVGSTSSEFGSSRVEHLHKVAFDPVVQVAVRDRWTELDTIRDRGWWLFRDMFVRQKRWTQLACLEVKPALIHCERDQRVAFSSLKRCIDCLGALILLVLLSSPLLVVMVFIRLDSRGPALFRHSRVGKDGKEFAIWKLRSMRVDAPMYERSPTNNRDLRLTCVGRIIRRISFDEIPQLVNVLKGEMSLVGPRPEMPFIVKQYSAVERLRLNIKPGITGLWQISNCRAAPIHQNLQYDFYYIKNQNIILDIAILVRTISATIRGVGAV